MAPQRPHEEAIFKNAVEIPNLQARSAYLDLACGQDAELRQRVADLLQIAEDEQSFLESPAAALAQTLTTNPLTESAGTVVGPYKLLQQIGEGGFGVVYMAEQTQPVRRKVALKIIKPGMDTKEVVARFEAERQALALMDHPHIAKVFDAGATQSGRPYFVMELVKGVPLTEYCDRNHLSAAKRLQLFISVCHAIQHAHQKGVIHRDLKPSNILVTLHDGRPVPKVIDFGVSKALSQQLTEKTLFTAFGQMVGTPAYMSPEQAEMSGLDIDTRSDVYSLGVLLYELLTGGTPFDPQRLRSAGYAEMQRIIREEEPLKPSTRLTSLGEACTVVSHNRASDPKKLGQLVRGDLDWIVMKALEKDRGRRYETANGFAADIERFLADEPVTACPPSTAYRFRKFARRNRAPLVTAGVALLALVALAIGSTIAAVRYRHLVVDTNAAIVAETEAGEAARLAQKDAEEARDQEQLLRKEAEQQTMIAQEALTEATKQRARAEANAALARSAVDEFLNQVTENELLTVAGLQHLRQALLTSAMNFYEEFTQDATNSDELLSELARAHYRVGVIRAEMAQRTEAAAANDRAIELFKQLRRESTDTLDVRLGLAKAYSRADRHDDTVTLCQEILEDDPTHAETRSLLAETYNTLAIEDKNANDIAAALAYHQKALALREALAREFPDNADYLARLGGTLNNLGVLLGKQGRNREALQMYQRGVSYAAEAYSKSPQTILWGRWLCIGLRNVGIKHRQFGQHDKALAFFERQVSVARKQASANPAVPSLKAELYRAWLNLARHQRQYGHVDASNTSMRAAADVLENISLRTPAEVFELAQAYAALAQPSAEGTDETTFSQVELQRYADLAMATLSRAVSDGYGDVNVLKTSTLLDALRERDDFRRLVETLETETRARQLIASELSEDRREGLQLLRELVDDSPDEPRLRRELAVGLNSIGKRCIEQEQFTQAEKLLREGLQIRKTLHSEAPEDSFNALLVGEGHITLGELYWRLHRCPEAVQEWDRGLKLFASHQSDVSATLRQQLSQLEANVYRHYGEVGLWERAAEYCQRVLSRGDSHDSHWDPRMGHVLAALGRFDEHAELCQLLAKKWSEANPDMVLWAAAMNPGKVLDPQTLVELAERSIETNRSKGDADFRAASAFFQAGQYERALELMLATQPRNFVGPHYRYWYAMVDHKLGDQEQAEHMLEQGEIAYRNIALRCLDSPAVTGVLDGHYGYWHAWAEDQVIRRQAWRLVRGQEPADDPWQHLIQARAYRLIGEVENAEAELNAAAFAAEDDSEVWMARIRVLEQWGEVERAEADWQHIVDRAGDDPMPWIHRGRWYAGRGDHEKAEADFAQAASLTPNELNKFLEAGWWVVGPYPADLAELCPPELNPDPSRSVHVIDPQTGLSDQPRAWRSIQTGVDGLISPAGVQGGNTSAHYALAYVYCEQSCCRFLRVSKRHTDFRVWVNGVEPPLHGNLNSRIPIVLKAGRNRLLFKCVGECRVNLGDSAVDQAWTCLDQGLWTQAAEIVRKHIKPNELSDKGADLAVHAEIFSLASQLIARARRLTELGRFDEAEADFNKAVELAPQAADVRVARASFYADRGEVEQAAAEFTKAYGQPDDHPVGRLLAAQRSPNVLHVWNFARSEEGWNALNQCAFERTDGVLRVTSNGNDPYFGRRLWAPSGGKELTICARVAGDLTSRIYWTTGDSRRHDEIKALGFPMHDSDGQWREYRVVFHPDADLIHLRLDPENKNGHLIDIAWMTLANRSLDDAIEIHPDDPLLIALRAERHEKAERWLEAEADYSKALTLRLASDWLIRRAEIRRIRLKQYEKAIADYTERLRMIPDDPWALHGRGAAYRELRRFDEALKDLDRATEVEPRNVWAFITRGHTYHDLHRFDEAVRDFTRAAGISTIPMQTDRSFRGLVQAYAALGQYDEALAACDRWRKCDPDSNWESTWRFRIYRYSGQLETALEASRARSKDEATHLDGLWELGATCAAMENWSEAIAAFDTIIEEKSEAWNAYHCRILLDKASGDASGLAAHCEQLLQIRGESENPSALRWTLAIGAHTLQDPTVLLRVMERAHPEPSKPDHFYHHAVALYHNRQYHEALEHLSQAQAPPWDFQVFSWFYLSMTHQRLGHTEEARKWLDKATDVLDAPPARHVATTWWANRLELQLLRREAEQLLEVQADSAGAESEPSAAGHSTGQ